MKILKLQKAHKKAQKKAHFMIDIQKGRHGAIYEIKLLFFTKWFFLFSNCHMIETVSIYCISRKSISSHFVMFDVVLGREVYLWQRFLQNTWHWLPSSREEGGRYSIGQSMKTRWWWWRWSTRNLLHQNFRENVKQYIQI